MSTVRVPILMYHQVDAIPPKRDAMGARTPYRSLIVSPGSFARQMWLLKIMGYRGVNMSEVMQYLHGKKTIAKHGKIIGITFDDGYQNNLAHALPVLARYGFSSTCYAVSDMAGQTNSWYASNSQSSSALMTAKEMQAWIAAGQEIGSHTQHHANLLTCDTSVARAEIFNSKQQLEALTGVVCKHFCYPYGFYNQNHVAMVEEAGYESATTVQAMCALSTDSVFALPRWGVLKNTSLLKLWWMIQKSRPRHY